MEETTAKVLETMRGAGKPVSAGEVATLSGLDRKEVHTYYRGVIEWMRRSGIRTLDLKREASVETVCGMTNTGSGDSFI